MSEKETRGVIVNATSKSHTMIYSKTAHRIICNLLAEIDASTGALLFGKAGSRQVQGILPLTDQFLDDRHSPTFEPVFLHVQNLFDRPNSPEIMGIAMVHSQTNPTHQIRWGRREGDLDFMKQLFEAIPQLDQFLVNIVCPSHFKNAFENICYRVEKALLFPPKVIEFPNDNQGPFEWHGTQQFPRGDYQNGIEQKDHDIYTTRDGLVRFQFEFCAEYPHYHVLLKGITTPSNQQYADAIIRTLELSFPDIRNQMCRQRFKLPFLDRTPIRRYSFAKRRAAEWAEGVWDDLKHRAVFLMGKYPMPYRSRIAA